MLGNVYYTFWVFHLEGSIMHILSTCYLSNDFKGTHLILVNCKNDIVTCSNEFGFCGHQFIIDFYTHGNKLYFEGMTLFLWERVRVLESHFGRNNIFFKSVLFVLLLSYFTFLPTENAFIRYDINWVTIYMLQNIGTCKSRAKYLKYNVNVFDCSYLRCTRHKNVIV